MLKLWDTSHHPMYFRRLFGNRDGSLLNTMLRTAQAGNGSLRRPLLFPLAREKPSRPPHKRVVTKLTKKEVEKSNGRMRSPELEDMIQKRARSRSRSPS